MGRRRYSGWTTNSLRSRICRFSGITISGLSDLGKGRLTLRSDASAPRTYNALLFCERMHWVELPVQGGRPVVVRVLGEGAAELPSANIAVIAIEAV